METQFVARGRQNFQRPCLVGLKWGQSWELSPPPVGSDAVWCTTACLLEQRNPTPSEATEVTGGGSTWQETLSLIELVIPSLSPATQTQNSSIITKSSIGSLHSSLV